MLPANLPDSYSRTCLESPNVKTCATCGEVKACSGFGVRRDRHGRAGLKASCKACGRAYWQRYYEAHHISVLPKQIGRSRVKTSPTALSRSREYTSWRNAKERCFNPKHKTFTYYGGRGITMCPEWRDDFSRFLADMGPRLAGTSLDRYPDPDGPYAPWNCRWATHREQQRNRRNNRLVTFNGETLCVADWEARLGFPKGTVSSRLRHGWSVERACTESIREYRVTSTQSRGAGSPPESGHPSRLPRENFGTRRDTRDASSYLLRGGGAPRRRHAQLRLHHDGGLPEVRVLPDARATARSTDEGRHGL